MTGVGADFQIPAPSSSRRPVSSVMPLARTVQWAGGGDGELEDGFEVGLVEGREDALDVFHEHLGVDVRLPVRGVGEAVQAFAGAGVAHPGVDAQLVGAFGQAGEGEAVAVEAGGVEGVAVEFGGAQFVRFELHEGVGGVGGGGADAEADDDGGVEGVVADGEVEGDGVVVDVECLGSELRFGACQCGHGAHAAAKGCRAPGGVTPRRRRSSRGGG
ncbi:hypothetical protein GCM10020254_61610 [Streptomyces goshikiensis]